jgi:uncharacterized protein
VRISAMSPARSFASAQARSLRQTGHRPWPAPDRTWVQGQTWCDLLFAHWRVSPQALRTVLPAEIPVDLFDGSAWIGVTPFEVRGLRPRGAPPMPLLSRFPEVNVRTYATIDGKPGIWFLSLDASSRLAVAGARRVYRLPYHRAEMAIERRADGIAFRSRRIVQEASLSATYAPSGPRFAAMPGSLEHFLTERYCLYTLDAQRRILRADIHHAPWPLQPADGRFDVNTMTAPYGISLPPEPPLLHFAARQDVVIWALRPIRELRSTEAFERCRGGYAEST